jgi:metal-sulfur cluster biosynthetic enzyme
VTDGNGVLFVDHLGEIHPSGFLPIPAGSVRTEDLVRVYRESPLFRALRDPARLGGRCGRCDWRDRCGGSRARACAATGDPLAEDPGCAYDPPPAMEARPGPARDQAAWPRPGRGYDHALAAGDDPGRAGAPAGGPRVIAGGAPSSPAVTADAVTEALRGVLDPELGLSIVDLGLVYGVEVREGAVAIRMTLTSPGCPLHEAMPEWVRRAVTELPGVERVEVALTFDPPWTPARVAAPGG